MKKMTLLGLLLSSFVWADSSPVGPGVYEPPKAPETSIYYHIGPLNLTVPWHELNATYLYDFQREKSLVGGESVIALLWKLQATVGAVTSLDGKGSPFVGGNIWFPNPIPQVALLSQIKPGVFGGYDWIRGAPMFGVKASINIF